ncbi:endonuclease [Deinococcus koreensis]|uniref:Serine protease n=1 Tax=Deinococcus koreensis TaxID=2054903 RepID=A0A2K3UWV2_9DEIO|nr:endonuclease [Deinococcus koreensis]PNY81022.1 hypothetical protein CVO96_06200 [Deinococcus koreensis]
MDIPREVLDETQARFEGRGGERALHLERLNVGGPLAAETPDRLEARLSRLGVPQPEAAAIAHGREEAGAVAARLPEDARLRLERVLGANDLVGVAYLDQARSASRAVGRIVLRDDRGRTLGFGTGWLCSPQVIVTNHHVLEDAASAAASVIEFDYELRPDGTLRTPLTLKLDPGALFLTSVPLDYTLVAVQGSAAGLGWLPLFGSADKNVLGEALSIVQHPSGEPKQVALRENRLVDRLPDFLHYETDTAPGSSGSPVFNDAWEVVALHHSGVPRTDDQGRVLRRDGQPLQPGDPDTLIDWIANEGVRISRLLDDLRARPDAQGSELVRAVLAARRPAPVGPPEAAALAALPGEPRPEGAPALDPGTIDFGTVDFGTLDLGTITPDAQGVASWPVTLRVRVGGPEVAPQPPAPARPYLPPQDEADARAYYAGLSPEPEPRARFLALSELLTRTHVRMPHYDPAAEVYPWVDLWPDGQLRSLYSGRGHSSQAFVAADQATSRRRQQLAAQEGLNAEALEDALPYNCEHVVPQSWFGKREPMRGDLHHLFACEPDCNAFRGNTPFADFPDYGEVIRSECGRREPGEFEPAQGKGAAARATLYFLLRYPGVIRQYSARHLQILLNWHAARPPAEWERHRNAAIFQRQGNRNPLIDRPDWGAQTDFSEGLGR